MSTMMGVHFLGKGEISLTQLPVPGPSGTEVLVRVRAAAICGTDRVNLHGSGQLKVPGHENAGEVVAVDKPHFVRPGDRVAINCHITCHSCPACLNGDLYFCDHLQIVGFDRDGGFADYTLVPEACCIPLPDDISFEMGSLLVDMIGTASRGVKRGRLLPGDRVAVWGAGPIGLSALLVAKYLGAQVASLDLVSYRLTMAKRLGADLVINASETDPLAVLRDWTKGRGVDVGFECIGSQKAAQQALTAVKNRGKLGIIGVSQELIINPETHMIAKELTIFGSRNFNTHEFEELVGMVRRAVPFDQIVTHRFPLAEAKTAFEVYSGKDCGKVLFVA